MREYWMRSPWLRRLCIVLLACSTWSMAGPAHAATGTVTYTAPTTRVDGTPLAASEITGFEFQCGAGTTTGVVCAPVTVAGTARTAAMTIALPAAGGTACVEGRTLTAALMSAWSVPSCKVYSPPGVPGTVTLAVVIGMDHAPVYSVSSSNRLSTLVGFIPTGRQCGAAVATYRGAAFREVDRAGVLWWGSTSLRVAAPCGEG